MLQNPGLTRRGLLMLTAGAGAQSRLRLYAASSDFWNKKEPAEWSSEEIDRLVTKSPWARQVNASSAAMSRQSGGSGGGGGNGGGMGDPGIGGGGGGYPGSRLRLYAASSDFWNKKEPAEWSSEEIDRLVTKSIS